MNYLTLRQCPWFAVSILLAVTMVAMGCVREEHIDFATWRAASVAERGVLANKMDDTIGGIDSKALVGLDRESVIERLGPPDFESEGYLSYDIEFPRPREANSPSYRTQFIVRLTPSGTVKSHVINW